MNPENIRILIEKYFEDSISPEEIILLEDWYRQDSGRKIDWKFTDMDDEVLLQDRIFLKVEDRLKAQNYNRRLRGKWYRIAAAAVILIFLASGIFMRSYISLNKDNSTGKTAQDYHNDISPGGYKAVLTLGDGSKVDLDSSHEGLISEKGGVIVNKEPNGKLVYTDNKVMRNEQAINVLSTPRGGQYQVVLSDGTKVWLNSESSLKFITKFYGNQREVELNGEGYFEVAKNSRMPFYVKTGDIKVMVLGTHFNIKAYKTEGGTRTTLLEGSVKVINGKESRYITPGQEAVTDSGSTKIAVNNAKIDEALAWQKGYYVFKERSINSIMEEIARWYDIEVVYRGNINDLTFSGKISRNKNISQVLGLLELTGDVSFKIEGRRVMVMR
jgi:transmembrane sensor